MNRIKLFKEFFLILALFNMASAVYAEDSECWVEFYDASQYTGKSFRLQGPAQLANLNNVNGESWDKRIDSLKTGSKTKVTVFENPNFKLTLTEMAQYPELMRSLGVTEQDIKEDSELIFIGNEKIHDLSDFNFHKKVRSLKVECE
jgi:Beta/Gamma crystallin